MLVPLPFTTHARSASLLCLALMTVLPACPSGAVATDATATNDATGDTTAQTTAQTTAEPTDGVTSTGTTGAPAEPPERCDASEHFAAGKTPTRRLHVSPGGSDSPGCGAEASPCASVAAAAGAATPGTAVLVHEGTYTTKEVLADLTGTADAPIWIGGAPGEARPVFTGDSGGMSLSRAHYVVLHDLEFNGGGDTTKPMLLIDDGGEREDPDATGFVAIEHMSFDNSDLLYVECVKLAGVHDFWVLDSEIARCGDGAGAGVMAIGSRRGLIAGNTIRDVDKGLSTPGGSADIELRGNRVYADSTGVTLGGSVPEQYFRPPLVLGGPNVEARNIRAVANLIVGGIVPLEFANCVDCLAANNTIIDPYQLLRISSGSGTSPNYPIVATANGQLVNNLFVFHTDTGYFDYVSLSHAPLSSVESFLLQSNLWYAVNDPAASSPKLGKVVLIEIDGIAGIDPRLVDVAGGDYHLAPDSPAHASGAPLSGLSGDIDSFCYGDPSNRGAFAWP